VGSFPRPSNRATTGDYVIKWIETFVRLGTGDEYGAPLVLREFQRDFIRALYEVEADGVTRYWNRAILGVPKGGGKTQLCAAIAAYELCGNVHTAPEVAVCASSFDQAGFLFDDLRAIMVQSPDLAALTDVHDTEINLRNEPGRAYRVAAVAGQQDGARPTCVVFDELHEIVGNRERVHLVLSNGTAKRKGGFTLGITTAGWDPESLLGRLYDHGLKVNAGEVDDRFLCFWHSADPDIEPKTRDEWRDAIRSANPAAGDFLDLESVVSRAMEMPLFEAKRYMLNCWSAQESQWEVAGLWPGLKSDLQLDPDKPLWAAADVGVVHDSSAVVWCQKIGEKYVLRSKIWDNPNPVGSTAYQRWRFELSEIEDFIRELAQKFPRPAMRDAGGRSLRGPAIYYDPNRFLRSAQTLTAEGLNLIEWPQSLSRLVPAAQCMFELVKDGNVAHDGDPALLSHVRNVVARQTPRGWRIDKPSHSPKNIDGALACAMVLWECSKQEAPGIEPRIRIMNLGIEDED